MRRLAAVVALAVALVATTAGPARAELDGGCQATGAFASGTTSEGPFTVDAAAVGTETVVVPRQDSVAWTGEVGSPPGEYAGWIAVDLPAPFGSFTIDTWDGVSDATANEGVEEYDLPALVPSGVTFQVVGEHRDQATACTGFVNVEIEGSPFSSPITLLMLGLTAVVGWGFFLAIRPLFRRVA